MTEMQGYILSVVGASLIAGVVTNLFQNSTIWGPVIKLLTGIFLTITMVTPLLNAQQTDIGSYVSNIQAEANAIVADGKNAAISDMQSIIKRDSEAYILDKAAEKGLTLTVNVEVSDTEPLYPISVSIKGHISPYERQYLETIICSDLGIQKENQEWI